MALCIIIVGWILHIYDRTISEVGGQTDHLVRVRSLVLPTPPKFNPGYPGPWESSEKLSQLSPSPHKHKYPQETEQRPHYAPAMSKFYIDPNTMEDVQAESSHITL
jgi:hypothetical protein